MSVASTQEIQIALECEGAPAPSSVTGLLTCPRDPWLVYVLAHGAGAGMRHRLMEGHAQRFAERGIATVRYNFAYIQSGRRRPDPPKVLTATVRSAVAAAAKLVPELPLIAGGRSMGGRMTSNAAAEAPLPGVLGIAFLAFPLHPAKKPGTARAAHLERVELPMLFLQGTRDQLADLTLLEPICSSLPGATVEILEGADHSFGVLKRSGRTDEEVQAQITDAVERWARELVC